MSNLKTLPTTDIETELIAQADDPDAWEEPVRVPPSSSPRPAWYGRAKIPLEITLANCGEFVNADEVYDFINANVTGATAYQSTGTTTAAVDFCLVLDAFASVASIADVLWRAYERFIAPRRSQANKSGIYIVVRGRAGEVDHLWLGNDVSTMQEFTDRLNSIVEVAKNRELEGVHEAKIRELQSSGSWVKLDRNRR